MDTVPRIVTIWVPDWPVVAAGGAADTPVAVLHANRVVARSAVAAERGVVIGQRRRQAQQRCPEVELIPHDPRRDAREFESVVRAVADLAPRFDVVEPGWITLAARGPARYHGGDGPLAERLAAVVAQTIRPHTSVGGHPPMVGVGIADGRFAAGVAARLAVRREQPVIVEPGGSPAFCAPLPIGWLHVLGELEPEQVDLFMRLGLRRLGDLAALPVSDVLGRFGPVGAHAHRLAGGGDARPSSTTDPAPERRLTRVLDDPVARLDAVVFTAKQLADELTQALAAEGRVCIRLVVLLETEHGERSERCWYRSSGLSATAMVERVRWQLDGWIGQGGDDEITAGVALVRLTPEEVRADDGDQLGLWGGESDADRRAARAIARLSTLTSEMAVTVPVWKGGRLPGDRYRWVPAMTVDLDERRRAVSPAGTGSGEMGPWPGSLPPPSPATVLIDPRPVEVVDDEGEPVTVSGRGVVSGRPAVLRPLAGSEEAGWRRGRPRTITAWAGPWPVEERWWEPGRHRRVARLQVVTDDGRAHLVIAEHRRWWISATYD